RGHPARVPAPDARRRSVFRTARVPSTALPPSDRGITDPEKAKDLWTQPMPHRAGDILSQIPRYAAAGATIGLRVGCAPERPAEIQQLVCNSDKARVLLGCVAQTDL